MSPMSPTRLNGVNVKNLKAECYNQTFKKLKTFKYLQASLASLRRIRSQFSQVAGSETPSVTDFTNFLEAEQLSSALLDPWWTSKHKEKPSDLAILANDFDPKECISKIFPKGLIENEKQNIL